MKCVCWEMATIDYEYRYDFTKSPLGECSTYKEKQKIYKDLVGQLEKHGLSFPGFNLKKNMVLREASEEVLNAFSGKNLSIWAQDAFLGFRSISGEIRESHFATESSLFPDGLLRDIYDKHLYRQRNRIAHNTPSYQQNLPTLGALMRSDYKYENYFLYFYVLVLIDKIFIKLYERYLQVIVEREN